MARAAMLIVLLTVACGTGARAQYGFRIGFIGPGGQASYVDQAEESGHRSQDPPAYIRARVQRSDGARAWVQPVMLGGED